MKISHDTTTPAGAMAVSVTAQVKPPLRARTADDRGWTALLNLTCGGATVQFAEDEARHAVKLLTAQLAELDSGETERRLAESWNRMHRP